MRHRPSVAEKCDTRAARAVVARLGLSEIGPVLTKLAGRGDPCVQHFALQQLASLTATVGDHETAILELQRQVASLAPDVQSLDTKVRELGVLLSESLSVVEGFVAVMDEDLKSGLEAMEKKVMPQRMVQLERLSGQVDRLSAQTGAALRASKNLIARVAKNVTELEDHCTVRVF